jgi:large subunit ribosomal protein L3
MPIKLRGRKQGMTHLFTESGEMVPVTLVEVLPHRVSQIKTVESDGYRALQLVTGEQKPSRINKPMSGHFVKNNVHPGLSLHECRLETDEHADIKINDEFKVDVFSEGQKVDVRGVTRGKGFAGTVKRHNFGMQDATHGNSLSHRAPGSIGQNTEPGRVMKGKRMAGHMGNAYRTVQNQEIMKVDVARNILLIRGALPGAPDGIIIIKRSIKGRGA